MMARWLRALMAWVVLLWAGAMLFYLWLSLCGMVAAAPASQRALQVLERGDVLPPIEKPLALTQQSAAERRAFIDACEADQAHAAVVLAGVVSSRGIVCVPTGD